MPDTIANSTATTATLALNSSTGSTIDSSGDQDWFRISLNAGTTYTFRQDKTSGTNLDSYLRLMNSSGTQVAYNDDGGGNYNSLITYTPTSSGTFYVAAGGYSSSTGAYSLSATAAGGTTTTPTPTPSGDIANSTATTATLALNSSTGSTIDSSGDQDWFRISLNAGTTYTFRQDKTSGTNLDSYLRLMNSSGTQVAYNDDGGGNYNSLITYTPTSSGTFYVAAGGYSSSTGAYSLSATSSGSPTPTPTITSGDIFRAVGRVGSDGSDTGIFNAGKIRVMADFSKAAYNLQSWETASTGGQKINDPSDYADIAYSEVIAQGWVPLDLNPTINPTSPVAGQTVTNRMAGGYYTNGNAAAFVARSGDSLVISFRGTNDMGTNPYDTQHLAPDAVDWFFMSNHYQLFNPLITAIDNYVSSASNGVQNVYVTGHSLGGAMAIRFMADQDHAGSKYSAITFAAPGYIPSAGLSLAEATAQVATGRPWLGLATLATTLGTGAVSDLNRITHIEINGDGVPDAGPHGGRTIHFEGNETDEVFQLAANHSMDYYRQITDSVDPLSWQRILNESGDPNVLLGGQRGLLAWNDRFIVDGRLSGTNTLIPSYQNDTLTDPVSRDYDIFYGGIGNDVLTGGSDSELMLGGPGDDTIRGNGSADRLFGDAGNDLLDGGSGDDVLNGGDGNDILIGGSGADDLTGGNGADIFRFLARSEGRDTIRDFQRGTDKLQFAIAEFSQSANFVSNTNPVAPNSTPAFLYNTTTGILSYDSNGTSAWNLTSGITEIALLVGVSTLTASDFLFV